MSLRPSFSFGGPKPAPPIRRLQAPRHEDPLLLLKELLKRAVDAAELSLRPPSWRDASQQL